MFVLDTISSDDPEISTQQFERYYAYLASIRDQLPKEAYKYAVAPWHYNFGLDDPRCPHDAWVDVITLKEVAQGRDQATRELEMSVRLLNAQHTGYITFNYTGVARYSFQMWDVTTTPLPQTSNRGHHDWLIDEIRLSESGLVVHEVVFALGSHWLIECKSLSYDWMPISRGEK
jgi:hypothetical protein